MFFSEILTCVSHLGSELSDSGPRWQEGCPGAVLQMVIPQNSVKSPKVHLVFWAVTPGGVSFTFREEREQVLHQPMNRVVLVAAEARQKCR